MKLLKSWFKRCDHPDIRCVHGDEINNSSKGFFRVKFARARCVTCESYLYDHDLPLVCTVTGRSHRQFTPRSYK